MKLEFLKKKINKTNFKAKDIRPKDFYQQIIDRDENQSIGFKLPFVLDSGWDSMTTETIQSIKQNVLNLCSTEMGERIMQPTLGIKLRQFFKTFNNIFNVLRIFFICHK